SYVPGFESREPWPGVSGIVSDFEYHLVGLFLDVVASGVPLELQFIGRIGGPEIRGRRISGRRLSGWKIENFRERFDLDGMVFRVGTKNRLRERGARLNANIFRDNQIGPLIFAVVHQDLHVPP